MMTNATDVRERLENPLRDQALRAAGVSIPVRTDAAPFRAARARRPRWLAFLLRLTR
ncbi:MAG TPA: hypothetical protein VLK84_29700 [Longimicrobium sp.]|nr:hypothetical protein [Longimicrobium sp.]